VSRAASTARRPHLAGPSLHQRERTQRSLLALVPGRGGPPGRITAAFYEFDDQTTASTVVHLGISVGRHDLDQAARRDTDFAARASRAVPDASPLLISDGYDSVVVQSNDTSMRFEPLADGAAPTLRSAEPLAHRNPGAEAPCIIVHPAATIRLALGQRSRPDRAAPLRSLDPDDEMAIAAPGRRVSDIRPTELLLICITQ
jgi:hypothetical protein